MFLIRTSIVSKLERLLSKAYIGIPGPWLLQISVVWFSLMHISKNYLFFINNDKVLRIWFMKIFDRPKKRLSQGCVYINIIVMWFLINKF